MGNICKRKQTDPDTAWKEQNKAQERNPIFKYVNLNKGGKLIDAYQSGGTKAVEKIAKTEVAQFLYNDGNGHHVTIADYVRWQRQCSSGDSTILETKSDEVLEKEHENDDFNVVSEHEACWDLSKRGPMGETPFHFLYLLDSPLHSEVAKVLLKLYPKLALDIYEGEEYFGESALHIAVVFGDFDSVKLLVQNGANVNQRATGRFFLPEDQKKGKKSYTNYEGFAYYGEYPLAFAACTGNQDIYDYLLDHDANPDLQDSFGNTVAHMVVISDQVDMYKYIVNHHVKPAKTHITNFANLTPLTLASKLGRHKIFKEMLELGSIEFWRYSNITCSAYPLQTLDSIGPTGDTNWNSALMIIINGETDEHLEMLEGGVMRQLLDEKWKTFARKRFFLRLILAFLHLAFISTAVYCRPADNLLAVNDPKDIVRFVCEILVCLGCIGNLALEVVEIGSQGILGFLKNCRHAPAQTIFIVSCLFILACIPFRFTNLQHVEEILLILAVPGSWLFLLFFARVFQLTGPFVHMIYRMCVGDLLRFALIYLVFLVAFTQAFYTLFQGIDAAEQKSSGFATLGDTVLTLFQMTLGEFKYQAFDSTKYSFLAKFIFAVFMILVPILLLNMLIAMMGNTYQQVISKSEKEWRKQWAKIVVVLERGFSKKQLLQYQKEYSVKFAGPPEDDMGELADGEEKEMRALVVIKSGNKTKARQRKVAVNNWKRVGKEVIKQMKAQRKLGNSGPILLKKVNKKQKQKHNSGDKSDDDDDENDGHFANIMQQLAWEKDIDLTKGQAFISDPGIIENATPRSPMHRTMPPAESSPIPNGRPRSFPKHVKVPAGTPRQSPKLPSTGFNYNRVSPLTVIKQTPGDESNSDVEISQLDDKISEISQMDASISEISIHQTPRAYGNDRLFENMLPKVPEEPKVSWDVPKVQFKDPKSDDGNASQSSQDSKKKKYIKFSNSKSDDRSHSVESKFHLPMKFFKSKSKSDDGSGSEYSGDNKSNSLPRKSSKSKFDEGSGGEHSEGSKHHSPSRSSRTSKSKSDDGSGGEPSDEKPPRPSKPKRSGSGKKRKNKPSKEGSSTRSSSTVSLLHLSETEDKDSHV